MIELIDAAYQAYRDQGVALPDVSSGVNEAISAGQVWVIGDGDLSGVLMLSTDGDDAHLINVAVAPTTRGQGQGSILIRHAIELARAAGCQRVVLATHCDLVDSISLYQHLGWIIFNREGQRVRMVRGL